MFACLSITSWETSTPPSQYGLSSSEDIKLQQATKASINKNLNIRLGNHNILTEDTKCGFTEPGLTLYDDADDNVHLCLDHCWPS